MLPCGLYEEKLFSKDNLKEHLRGPNSQLLNEDEIKSEQDLDQDSKKEEQQQGQQEETQREGTEESSLLATAEGAGDKCRKTRKRTYSSAAFTCPECSFKTINKMKFKRHMDQMHLNKFECNQCSKKFYTEGILAGHVREKHMKDEEKPKLPEDEFFCIYEIQQGKRKKTLYKCLLCTLKPKNRSFMYLHIRGVHKVELDELYKAKGLVSNDEGYHKCPECFHKTLDMGSLKQHMKIVHQKRREFVCDLCKKTFSVKGNLTQHMKSVHISSESLELHKCPMCTYKTVHKTHLKRHVNAVHLKNREFTFDLSNAPLNEPVFVDSYEEKVFKQEQE